MNTKLQQRVAEVVTPLLEPGETLDITSVASVGTVTVKRRLATAAVAGVLSGGMLMVAVQPKKFYLALTDRRLLLFEQGLSGRPVSKPGAILPRPLLQAGEVKRGLLTASFLLSIQGQEKGLKLTFPLPARDDAPPMAAALTPEPSPPA